MTPSTYKPDASTSPVHTPLDAQQVGLVFQRLQAQLGAKLADLWHGVPPAQVKEEWADALGGFRGSEIKRGLDACQRRAFPPTLGEFTNLCRPALDPEIAWREATEGMRARVNGELGEWSHPAVYRAAAAMAYELRSKSFKEARKVWTVTLDREFARGWIRDVPDAPLRLQHIKGTPVKPSGAVLERINAILATKPQPVAEGEQQP